MNNYQIILFNSLVKTGNFTKTAKDLNISYQNVIYQLTKLEDELSTRLFIRTRLGCKLTPTGKAVIPFFQVFQDNYARMLKTITDVSNNIIFGVDFSVTHPIISKYSLLTPNSNLQYFSDNYTSLYNDLMNGNITCYFGHEKNWDKSIFFAPIFEDQLCIITSTNNPMSQKKEIDFSNLINNIIDISVHTSVNSELPIDLLSRNNEIISNSSFSTFTYAIRTGNSISFSPGIFKYYSSSDFVFIPVKGKKLAYGLFFKYKCDAIDNLIIDFQKSAKSVISENT